MYQRISAIDISVFSIILCIVLFAVVTMYYLMSCVHRHLVDDYDARFVEDISDTNNHIRLHNNPLFLRRFLQQYAEYYNIENATTA